MIDQQLIFLGIIAICMVIITGMIIFFAIQYSKTMNKVNAFISLGQDKLSILSSNISVITQESSDLIEKVGNESQLLTNGIVKLTNASLAFKAFSQFFNKNPKIKEDNINKSNLFGFAVGAAITGISAYYVYKNKDEISNKINNLEETLIEDYGELVTKAKDKFAELMKVFQSTVE